jgi:phage tail tape-measure protein
MNFREWVKMYESPGLFGGGIWPQSPGTQRVNPKNWDMNAPGPGGAAGGFGATKGATPVVGGGTPPGALSGTGPALGSQVPRRMKKK